MWQQRRLPRRQGPPLNLARGERFGRQSLGCQPLCPKQGIESAEECSAILADPRCVLNIKSSAVIPLAAPNTNRGLPVAVATALLSNTASGGSASLWAFSLFTSTSPAFLLVPRTSSPRFATACAKGMPQPLAVAERTTQGPKVHLISGRWGPEMFYCSQCMQVPRE